jgi:hypothetical protein
MFEQVYFPHPTTSPASPAATPSVAEHRLNNNSHNSRQLNPSELFEKLVQVAEKLEWENQERRDDLDRFQAPISPKVTAYTSTPIHHIEPLSEPLSRPCAPKPTQKVENHTKSRRASFGLGLVELNLALLSLSSGPIRAQKRRHTPPKSRGRKTLSPIPKLHAPIPKSLNRVILLDL